MWNQSLVPETAQPKTSFVKFLAKGEPEWMLDFRLKSLEQFNKMPMQEWGPDLSDIDFSKIKYYQNRVTNPHAIGMMYLIKSKKPLKNWDSRS